MTVALTHTTTAVPPPVGDAPPGDEAPASPRRPAAETVRLYAADWNAFLAWCKGEDLAALPAVPATVAAYLNAGVATLSAGALARRAAAIAAQHRQAGLASPAGDPAVTAILRAARRAAKPRRPPPPRPARLVRMAGACQGGLAGARDRALLLLLAASGLGRAALVGLDFEHVRITDAGAELVITDPAGGGGRRVAVKRAANRDACPVQALKDWLATSETSFGPVFRKIDRWGNIEHRRLGTDALRRILARRTLRRGRTGKAAAA